MNSMKKVLVTGGAGFIGSHTVVELVAAGFEPIIIDNLCNSDISMLDGIEAITEKNIPFFNIDCTDLDAMMDLFQHHGPFLGVIHFAAFKAVGESVAKPLAYYHNNINSTRVVLECMAHFGVKNLVFSSSCTVYGQPKENPVSEKTAWMSASSPYGYTKQVCERMIADTSLGSNLSSVLLRYFNPIGAHPSGLIGELPLGVPENLIPYITQTAAGLRSHLTIFGSDYNTPDGTCIRDYIHVVDLAKAHVAALSWLEKQSPICEVFNLGSGNGNSVKEVIDTFQEVNNMPVNVVAGARRPGDVEQIFASADKAKEILNWGCELTLADALKDAWTWQLKLQE
ncbi:MAG: UDP-glucose 4-epimerase GalE [Cryomorphaceae bacterium]|nr:UDP-glucose 4-epimerase GalE [Cryomorphaceae bacterium]